MLFNSLAYAIFLPTVWALCAVTAPQKRWAILLGASAVFYGWYVPKYLLIFVALILVDYLVGIRVEDSRNKRPYYLALAIVANLGVLLAFKYSGWLRGASVDCAGLRPDILLPIGLSFHTLQSVSYAIEVYRGNVRAERHPGRLALFVIFFPQMVAGPIERPQNMLPQLNQNFSFEYRRSVAGLRRLLGGLIKKVLVADNLARFVDPVYARPELFSGPELILATVFYSVQIYADFSGYCDMAVGSARLFGIELTENFCRPYFARSVAEFWRRWHTSLSSWFRDYVYIPLGGGHVPPYRRFFNLVLVFALSGLWHGADVKFIVWGLLHAVYVIFGAIFRPRRGPRGAFSALVVFGLISFAWIFFRAASVGQALLIVSRLGTDWETFFVRRLPTEISIIAPLGALSLICWLAELWAERMPGRGFLEGLPRAVRWAVYYVAVLVLLFGGNLDGQQFIYFQF